MNSVITTNTRTPGGSWGFPYNSSILYRWILCSHQSIRIDSIRTPESGLKKNHLLGIAVMWSAYQNKLFLVLIKAGYIMTIKIKLDWFHWSTCTKPRKWEVMVNCVIFYLCFHHFVLAFQNSSDSVIFFVLIFYFKTII